MQIGDPKQPRGRADLRVLHSVAERVDPRTELVRHRDPTSSDRNPGQKRSRSVPMLWNLMK